MGFAERKKQEDEYIQQWLKNNNDWKKNIVGLLPDLTKPDGTFQDIKFINETEYSKFFGCYDLYAQKKGIIGGEIDDWDKEGIIEKCEYKFICYDKKIFVINCKTYIDNVHKEFEERQPTEDYSGTAFYVCRIKDFNWVKNGVEKINNNSYDIYNCENKKEKCIVDYM